MLVEILLALSVTSQRSIYDFLTSPNSNSHSFVINNELWKSCVISKAKWREHCERKKKVSYVMSRKINELNTKEKFQTFLRTSSDCLKKFVLFCKDICSSSKNPLNQKHFMQKQKLVPKIMWFCNFYSLTFLFLILFFSFLFVLQHINVKWCKSYRDECLYQVFFD